MPWTASWSQCVFEQRGSAAGAPAVWCHDDRMTEICQVGYPAFIALLTVPRKIATRTVGERGVISNRRCGFTHRRITDRGGDTGQGRQSVAEQLVLRVSLPRLIRSMSQQSSSLESSARSASTTLEHQAQAQRHVPLFQPIDADKARARAAIEQWRTFTMLLEPQVGA